jgi:capsular polysaccharide export protein
MSWKQRARALRINLCCGDWLNRRRPGAVNYRGWPDDWPAFIEYFIVREAVTDIILLGEQRSYHQAAIQAAKTRGVTIVATDYGYLRPDWVTFKLDDLPGASTFPRDPAAIRALAAASDDPDLEAQFRDPFWAMTRKDILYHSSTSLLWFSHPHYESHQPNHPIVAYIGTGLRLLMSKVRSQDARQAIETAQGRTGQTFVFPLQIARNFSIRAYSPYEDLETPIRTVIQSFAANAADDATLVIKVHPLNPGFVSWRQYSTKVALEAGVADRVIYIDGGELVDLIDAAAGVVAINSTVGLQALRQGAIALGSAVYKVPGMTTSCSLEDFWQAPPPDLELVKAFIRAITGTIMVRRAFY